MEVHDDLAEHSGEGMAKLTAMVEGIARTLKVANQRQAASASTGSASKSAAAAEPSAGGDSGEDRNSRPKRPRKAPATSSSGTSSWSPVTHSFSQPLCLRWRIRPG